MRKVQKETGALRAPVDFVGCVRLPGGLPPEGWPAGR